MDLRCFSSLHVQEPVIEGKRALARIETVDIDGVSNGFELSFKYDVELGEADPPLLRLAAAMPLVNYGLFSDEISLGFEVSRADLKLLEDLLVVFGMDILVNKVLRRRADYILGQYLPGEGEVRGEGDVRVARLSPLGVYGDEPLGPEPKPGSCGVLSSGGKESLLTYGMLRELGAEVHPLYVNESGGHWRTALTAYRRHTGVDPNTSRVWTDIDRFYVFMLDRMRIIRGDHRKVRADTYPIRLCIFPVYVHMLLPLFARRGIGNLLIGSEFDDLREPPVHSGIGHHYGVYDQSIDYDRRMDEWYGKRLPGMRQWSALRTVSGLVVERTLVRRYPELARLQRSCHSAHLEGESVVQCGECSKCLGVMLFLRAVGGDPASMLYEKRDVDRFWGRVSKGGLRLDQDEREHALLLAGGSENGVPGAEHWHVDTIHLDDANIDVGSIPPRFRDGILGILEEHTNGYSQLKDGAWVPTSSRPQRRGP